MLRSFFAVMVLESIGRIVAAEPTLDEAPPTNFHAVIAAQPLVQSLVALSRISGQALIYNPAQIPDKNAPALQGDMTSQQALASLLRDTGLQASWHAQGWIIKPAPANNPELAINESAENLAPAEEILVTGYYSHNLQTALAQKRASNQLIDAVVAEDIEHIPAQNIAEALQHSPGVTVVRDRGEALFVSIRGLPSSFNKVTLNGQNLASNENVRNSGQYGRRFHFDTFPTELAAGVEVIKTASAAQDEGAIGGNINLRTFAPFDLPRADLQQTQISLAAALDESQLTGTDKPRLSGLASWINSENTFGVTLAASYAERSLRQDRALNFGWQTLEADDKSSLISPMSLRPTLELEERKREGITATLQWRWDNNIALDIHSLWLAQTIHYDEFSYGAGYGLDVLQNGSALVCEDALYAGSSANNTVQVSRESAGITDNNYMLDGAVKFSGERWLLSSNWAATRAHSFNDDPIKRIRLHSNADSAISFNFPRINGERIPDMALSRLVMQDAEAMLGRRLEWRLMDSHDGETAFGINATYRVDGEWLDGIEMGVKTSSHERRYKRKDVLITNAIAEVQFPAEAYAAFPVDNFLASASGNLPRQWLVPREDYFWGLVDEGALYQQSFDQQFMTDADRLNSYRIRERTSAIFVQANLHHQVAGFSWRADIGLRAVQTQQHSFGYSLPANSLSASSISYTNTYDKLLPSANLVLDFSPEFLWRSAISETMARPDFQDIAPRITLNSGGELTAVGGNPALKPVRAQQVDSALEWYFAESGLLSGGVFYKQLRDFFQNQISQLPMNGKNYALSSIGNGARAYARGLELAYQQKLPAPFNHLGIESNYTYTDSRARYWGPQGYFYDQLADVAKNSINLGVYVETQTLNARLHYSWRDRVLNQVGMANTSALNAAAFGSLDMHLGYSPDAHWSLNLDAINLANSAQQEFVANNEFASYTLYGRRFLVGVKWNLGGKE